MLDKKSMNNFKPGDLVSFAGKGFQSRTIAIRTGSWIRLVSHVGILFNYNGRLLVGESTTLNEYVCEITKKKTAGVQAHSLENKVKYYSGKIWVLPLNSHRELCVKESDNLTRWIIEYCEQGTAYDLNDALKARFRFIYKWLYPDKTKMFCSELVHSLYADLKRLPPSNNIISPISLERKCRRAGLCEAPIRIK